MSVWRCESPGAFDPIKRKKEKNPLIWMVERVYILFILRRRFLAFLLARRFPTFTFGCRPPPVETRERRHENTKKEEMF